jgi:hypothetical protein
MWGLWWTKRHWGRFSPSTSVSPANHSTNFSISIIIRGWHNRPNSGRSVEWTQLDSTPHYTKKNFTAILLPNKKRLMSSELEAGSAQSPENRNILVLTRSGAQPVAYSLNWMSYPGSITVVGERDEWCKLLRENTIIYNVILQHPVALQTSDFAVCLYAVYEQRRLLFTRRFSLLSLDVSA